MHCAYQKRQCVLCSVSGRLTLLSSSPLTAASCDMHVLLVMNWTNQSLPRPNLCCVASVDTKTHVRLEHSRGRSGWGASLAVANGRCCCHADWSCLSMAERTLTCVLHVYIQVHLIWPKASTAQQPQTSTASA